MTKPDLLPRQLLCRPRATWPLLLGISLGLLLGGCRTGRSAKKFKNNPLGAAVGTANEALDADAEIKLACQDAEALFGDIRSLASEFGRDYVLSAQIVNNIKVRVNSIRQRITRLVKGGLGTAIAAGVNYDQIGATLQNIAALLGGGPGALTAGSLADATQAEAAPNPEAVFANRPPDSHPADQATSGPQTNPQDFDGYLAQVKSRRDKATATERKREEAWQVVSKVAADPHEKLHTRSRLLKGFLERFPADNPHEQEARALLTDLLPGVMLVKSIPPGAQVSFSRGLPGGQTPLTQKAKAGTYLLTLSLRGHVQQTRKLKVEPGEVSRIQIQLQESRPGTLAIKSNPPGAQVLIDGKKAGTTPVSGKVKTGTYVVQVSADGYLSNKRTVEVVSDSVTEMAVDLEPMAPGTLLVTAWPRNTKLRIGDAPPVKLPSTRKLERGAYRLLADAPGFDSQEQEVQIVSGKTTKVAFKLQKTPSTFFSVQSQPKGALIFIDGKKAGKAPLRRKVLVGQHRVTARLPDHQIAEQDILFERDQEITTVLNLTPGQGTIRVTTDPIGAVVFLGGEVLGPSPLTTPAPAGTVTIKAEMIGHHPAIRKQRVSMGRDGSLHLKLRKIKPAQIAIGSRPPGAEVLFDGVPVGTTPYRAEIPPSSVEVALRLAGHEPVQKKLTMREGAKGGAFFKLVKIPLSVLSVQTTPPGALVTIDGQEAGAAPLKRLVLPGPHAVIATLAGHDLAEQVVEVLRKRPAQAHLTLQEIRQGRFTIQTDPPQAQIWLDGKPLGTGQTEQILASGRHTIKAELDKHTPAERVLEVQGGEQELIVLALPAIPEGRLQARTDPPGAQLTLDGAPWGPAPQEKALPPGLHKIGATLADHEPAEKSTLVMNGQVSELMLVLKSSKGVLAVASSPSGAEVLVDGKSMGRTPLDAPLLAGTYDLEVRAKPYIPMRRKVTVPKADKVFIEAALDSAPDGLLIVRTAPSGATISMDGKAIGMSPLEERISPGNHTLEISRDQHAKQRKLVYANPSQVTELDLALVEVFELDPLEKWGHSAFWTGLTLAGVGAAATFKARELDAVNGGFRGADGQASTWSALMISSFAAGGALMVTGIVLWALSPDDAEYARQHRTGLVPTADGAGLAVTVGGGF